MTTREEFEKAMDEIEGWGNPPGNYLRVKDIRSFVSTLDAEIAALKKRCRYNLEPGAIVSCWDEYEVLREKYDKLQAKFDGAQD